MVRFKNRYLLCEIDTAAHNALQLREKTTRDIASAVRTSLALNFGDLAFGHISPSLVVKLWSPSLSLCLIRVARDHHRTLWATVTLISSMRLGQVDAPVRFSVIHVGGTIRSCQDVAINRARELVLEARNVNDSRLNKIEAAAESVKHELKAMDV